MEPLTIVSTVVGVCSLAFNVFQGRRSYRLSRQIASAQGQLSSPDLSLTFMGYDLSTHFVIIAPRVGTDIIDFPIRFILANHGAKTAREIDLLLRLPKPLIYGGTELSKFRTQLPKETINFRSVATSKNLETLLMSIPSLNPGGRIGLDLSLSIMFETLHSDKSEVQFTDGMHLIPWEMAFCWDIAVALTQSDRAGFSKSVQITVLNLVDSSPATTMRLYNEKLRSIMSTDTNPDRAATIFIISEDGLEIHPQFRRDQIVRPKEGKMLVVEGAVTSNGFFVPGLNVAPAKLRKNVRKRERS